MVSRVEQPTLIQLVLIRVIMNTIQPRIKYTELAAHQISGTNDVTITRKCSEEKERWGNLCSSTLTGEPNIIWFRLQKSKLIRQIAFKNG